MYKIITPTIDGRKQYRQSFIINNTTRKPIKGSSYKPSRRGYRDCY